MIKTLLIDDNQVTLTYYREKIDWNKCGFELVGTAANGIQGWTLFQKYLPELVITDVYMPLMNGIELTDKIKAFKPDTEVIFFSSYEEFSYVHAAIKLGVSDYILKHETRQENFYQKLSSIREKMIKSSIKEKHYNESNLLLMLTDPVQAALLVPQYEGKYDAYVIIQRHFLPAISANSGFYSEEPEEESFKSYCYEVFQSAFSVVKLEKYVYVVFSKSKKNESISINYANIIAALRVKFNFDFFFWTIALESDFMTCIKEYHSGYHLVNEVFFYPMVVPLTEHLNEKTHDTVISTIDELLNSQSYTKLMEEVDRYYALAKSYTDFQLLNDLTDILVSYIASFHNSIANQKTNEVFVAFDDRDSSHWYFIDEIQFWIKKKLSDLFYIFSSDTSENYSSYTRKALKYIRENYMNCDLSSEDISEYVNLSVSRLGVIIREDTGETIMKWITKIRMEKSKELIKNGYSITDVSEMTGYSNLSYFSRVFKKYVGSSPNEYRRSDDEKK